MSKTDPANYPECLQYREPEGEAKTRRLERLGDLHARAEAARKTRGPARIHYQLFMWSLDKTDLMTLGIPQSAILKYCTQFRPSETRNFNLNQLLREHAKRQFDSRPPKGITNPQPQPKRAEIQCLNSNPQT